MTTRLSTVAFGTVFAAALALAAPNASAGQAIHRTAAPRPPAAQVAFQRGHGGGGFHGGGSHGNGGGVRYGGGGFYGRPGRTVIVGGLYAPFWDYGLWGPGFWGLGWGPYWGGYYPGYSDGSGYGYATGDIKFDVAGPNPKDAQVYANGQYVGTVNEFHGVFHSLTLRPGDYRIEVRAPGYRPLTVNVHIQPDHTIKYRGEMQKAS